MRLFKKNDTQKNNKKLPMTGRVKKGFRFYCMVVMAMTVVLGSDLRLCRRRSADRSQ